MDTCRNGHDRSESFKDRNGKLRCRACAKASKQRYESRQGNAPSEPPPPPETGEKDVNLVLTSPITVDELLDRFKIDRSEWECVRFTCNAYPVSQKGPDGEPVVIQLYQAKAHLRRVKDAELLSEMRDALLTEIRALPVMRVRARKPDPESRTMFELSPMDTHINKLAWGKETGHADYDTAIAEEAFGDGVSTLLNRASAYKPAETVLVFGNDFFNVDGMTGATTAGTPQDVDSRYPKMFRTGVAMIRWAVQQALDLSPVKVIFVSGNHDGTTLWMLGEVIAACFEKHQHVTVDNGPTLRKYHRWGNVLLGYTHGDKEKTADLPLIMAHERPQDWASTTHREWHLGHLHKSMKWEDEYGGVRVRRLPSITPPDYWHSARAYIGAIRATEGYLWDKDYGYLGHLSHTVRP